MTEEQLPACGHPECTYNPDDEMALARALGFTEVAPGVMGFTTTDPAEAMRTIQMVTAGIDGAAQDIVAQAEALAARAAKVAESMEPKVKSYLNSSELGDMILKANGGRVRARKIGRRSFWQEVKRWLSWRRKA